MRVLIQRVLSAQVQWNGGESGAMGHGMMCLVGFQQGDSSALIGPMADKLIQLRIFEDHQGKMNRSLPEAGGDLMLVPQFTLYADCRKGRRPGFSHALAPDLAQGLFSGFQAACQARLGRLFHGRFGEEMQVHLINDGPVTLLLDSDELNLASKVSALSVDS